MMNDVIFLNAFWLKLVLVDQNRYISLREEVTVKAGAVFHYECMNTFEHAL
jgi:hypothetical protein